MSTILRTSPTLITAQLRAVLDTAREQAITGKTELVEQALIGAQGFRDPKVEDLTQALEALPVELLSRIRSQVSPHLSAADSAQTVLGALIGMMLDACETPAAIHAEVARTGRVLDAFPSSGQVLHRNQTNLARRNVEAHLRERDAVGVLDAEFQLRATNDRAQKHAMGCPHHPEADEFRGLVMGLPGAEHKILDHYRWRFNPLLNEFFSVYASVIHNIGADFSRDEAQQIAACLLEEVNRRIDRLSPPWPAGRHAPEAFSQALSEPATVCLEKTGGGAWRIFDGTSAAPKEASTAVLEVIRKRNKDKSGSSKYRFRATTLQRARGEVPGRYQPVPGWCAEPWHIAPNRWTLAMREGIAAALQHLAERGVPAFSISEGGAFKGTSIRGSDVDTTVYLPEGTDSAIRDEANLVFTTTVHRAGAFFTEGLRFLEIKADVSSIDLAHTTEMAKVERGFERGLLITDANSFHLVQTPMVLDLKDLRTRGILNVVDRPPD